MKVSIVTVSYNSSSTIKKTLQSVESQTWPDIEHILIDGNSSDHTVDIINEFPHVSRVVVEDDRGIYDAMNKGISYAGGDIIGFLNSDDWFYDNDVIENIVLSFKEKNVDAVFGDLVFVNNEKDNQYSRFWKSSPYKLGSFLKGWVPPHPTFYVKLNLINNLGDFDTNMRFAADYDLMCRYIVKYGISTFYLPGPKVKMRLGGATTKSYKNIYLGNVEIYKSLKNNGLNPKPSFFIYKFFSKFTQLINRKI